MRYVALLRGINVGGNNMIKMETLRATLSSLGFENVKSYINSGNLAFNVSGPDGSKGQSPDRELADQIHESIQKEFGFDISVMVRSAAEIKKIISSSPYEGQFDDDRYLHVFFLDKEPTNDQKERLLEQANENEMITVDGRTIYYLLRISIIDSAFGKGFIDKKVKIPATGRNWRTVKKLADL